MRSQPLSASSVHALPQGAVDAMAHIYGKGHSHALAADRTYDPPPATMEDLVRCHEALAIARGVLVQPTTYGRDHTVMFDALQAHPGRYAGVMLVGPETSDDDIARAHDLGVRGVRFHLWSFVRHTFDAALFRRTVDRIGPLGWHVKVHVKGEEIFLWETMIRECPITLVIDHMGHTDIARGPDQPAFSLLVDLLASGSWVQISNFDRWSVEGPPGYGDALPFVETLAATAPDRLTWGTDWPHILYKHPDNRVDQLPEDGNLLALLARAVPDRAAFEKILVHNPHTLYFAH